MGRGLLKIMSAIMSVLILILGLMAGCTAGSEQSQSPQPENPAPDFHLTNLDGQDVSLGDFRGRPVMLNFWASWCGPCRLEMPFIQEISEDAEFTDKGLVILAVNKGESLETVRDFMEGYGYSFPVLLDTAQSVSLEYNIRGIPTTLFIDGEGIIQDMQIGSFSSKAEIEWKLVNTIISDK